MDTPSKGEAKVYIPSKEELKQLRAPPGPKINGLSALKKAISWNNKDVFVENYNKYGSVFTMPVYGPKAVIIGEPNVMKPLLLKDGNWVKPTLPPSLITLFGKGYRYGEPHKQFRQMIADGGLGKDAVFRFSESVQAMANAEIDQWFIGVKESEYTEFEPLSRKYIIRSSISMLLGQEVDKTFDYSNLIELFEVYSKGVFAMPFNLPFTSLRKAMNAKEEIKSKMIPYLEEIYSRLEKGEPTLDKPGLMEAFLYIAKEREQLHTWPIDAAGDLICNMLFAAMDTTTSSFSSACLLFPQKEGLFEKLRQEQIEVVKKHGENFTKEAIEDMTLLRASLYETFRVANTTALNVKVAQKPFAIERSDGKRFLVKKGQMVILLQKLANSLGDEPGKQISMDWKKDVLNAFDPEANQNKFVLPFSYGIRSCAGQNFVRMKMLTDLGLMLRKGTWSIDQASQETEFSFDPVPLPQDGLKVKFVSDPLNF